MRVWSLTGSKPIAARIVAGIVLALPLAALCGDGQVSLDDLNRDVSVVEISPVAIDGKRVVAEKERIEKVANHLCERFGGNLKSLELDLQRPIGRDEIVSYYDGVDIQHYRLNRADQFTALKSVICIGLVLGRDD